MKLKACFEDLFESLKYLCLCRYRTPSEQSYEDRLYLQGVLLQRMHLQNSEAWSSDEEIFVNKKDRDNDDDDDDDDGSSSGDEDDDDDASPNEIGKNWLWVNFLQYQRNISGTFRSTKGLQ